MRSWSADGKTRSRLYQIPRFELTICKFRSLVETFRVIPICTGKVGDMAPPLLHEDPQGNTPTSTAEFPSRLRKSFKFYNLIIQIDSPTWKQQSHLYVALRRWKLNYIFPGRKCAFKLLACSNFTNLRCRASDLGMDVWKAETLSDLEVIDVKQLSGQFVLAPILSHGLQLWVTIAYDHVRIRSRMD